MTTLLAQSYIRDVPDFPKPGIMFKDIAPVLQHPAALEEAVQLLTDDAKAKGAEVLLSSTVGSEAWNSRDLKSRPH